MDVEKMLAELRQEREAIEEAILTLERLANGQGRRRGRPPAWMVELKKKRGELVQLAGETAPARRLRARSKEVESGA